MANHPALPHHRMYLQMKISQSNGSCHISFNARKDMPEQTVQTQIKLIQSESSLFTWIHLVVFLPHFIRVTTFVTSCTVIPFMKMGQTRLKPTWKQIPVQGSKFLKNKHFFIQERLHKLIYGIITIIKCGTWQYVIFQLVSLSWNEMIFYIIYELMLPILIQSYHKKSFHFWPSSKHERLTEILQAVRCHILWPH